MSKILTAAEFFQSKSPIKKKAQDFQKALKEASKSHAKIVTESKKAQHSKHHSPYGLTSGEELDKLETENTDLYSAIVNWN